MKKLFLILGLLFVGGFSQISFAQEVYPTGHLSDFVIFINEDWEVVILVTCDAPHNEYCTNTPKDRGVKGQNLVEALNRVISNSKDFEIQLVQSDSQKNVYMYKPKKEVYTRRDSSLPSLE